MTPSVRAAMALAQFESRLIQGVYACWQVGHDVGRPAAIGTLLAFDFGLQR